MVIILDKVQLSAYFSWLESFWLSSSNFDWMLGPPAPSPHENEITREIDPNELIISHRFTNQEGKWENNWPPARPRPQYPPLRHGSVQDAKPWKSAVSCWMRPLLYAFQCQVTALENGISNQTCFQNRKWQIRDKRWWRAFASHYTLSSLHAPHMSGAAGGSPKQHATRIRALQQHKSRSPVRCKTLPKKVLDPSRWTRVKFNGGEVAWRWEQVATKVRSSSLIKNNLFTNWLQMQMKSKFFLVGKKRR